MKAVLCEQLGTPDDLVLREVDDPGSPGEGEVAVALEVRGISYTDLLMVAGQYQVKPDLPFVVGGQAAGRITAVGPGVTGLKAGDPVLAGGGCIERTVSRADRVTRLPERRRSRGGGLLRRQLRHRALRPAAGTAPGRGDPAGPRGRWRSGARSRRRRQADGRTGHCYR